MNNYIRNSVIATVVYYDIFDFPLTLVEIYKFLINPKRLIKIDEVADKITISQIAEEIDGLIETKILANKNGFYFLYGRDNLYDTRIERQKIAEKKWKKFLRYAKLLTFSPYLRGFFACGSMALNNTTQRSDFDVFVIGHSQRLYTCRFFVWLIASLLGARRRPSDKVAPDKLCFNHYITDASLFLKYQSLYTAQLYSSLKPVFMSRQLLDKFFEENSWIKNYMHNFEPEKDFVRIVIKKPLVAKIISGFLELVFETVIGDILEYVLKKYQQSRIIKNPLTGQPGGRVVCSNNELEFHPHSFEGTVIQKYNDKLGKLGIILPIKEKDSGLVH